MTTTSRSDPRGFKELDRVFKPLPGRLAERELTSAVRGKATVAPERAERVRPNVCFQGLSRRIDDMAGESACSRGC